MTYNESEIWLAADRLLTTCGTCRSDERVVVICDDATHALGIVLAERAAQITNNVELLQIPPLAMHGVEPPERVAAAMHSADLILGLTTYSMAHTRARQKSAEAGARYLSLPDYSFELLCDESMLADFRRLRGTAEKLASSFTEGHHIKVTTDRGTLLSLNIEGRVGNCCPGFVESSGELGSPPDIEANISPIETDADGIVIIDGSVPCPEIGLLKEPITLIIANGSIKTFDGPNHTTTVLRQLFDRAESDKAYVLAECGVGLNEKAKLIGNMLTDEGAYGTAHLGFGSNSTVGGLNAVPFHLDFVFQSPSMWIDGQQTIKDGSVIV